MNIIAMIPARLGSKRIPQKNIRLLDGKPLLQYAIEKAVASNCFEEIWVNSESDIIGKIARSCRVKFHKRPEELSSDNATNDQFTAEFLKNHDCDFLVMINSTSPLLKADTVKDFVNFIKRNEYDTVISVIDEYAECFYNDQPINFSINRKVNSQELKPVRKIVWSLTAWRRKTFLQAVSENKCGTFSGKIGLFPIPKDESCDLDTPEDWIIAEGMIQGKKMSKKEVKYWSPK